MLLMLLRTLLLVLIREPVLMEHIHLLILILIHHRHTHHPQCSNHMHLHPRHTLLLILHSRTCSSIPLHLHSLTIHQGLIIHHHIDQELKWQNKMKQHLIVINHLTNLLPPFVLENCLLTLHCVSSSSLFFSL